jgi:hypothetical protein
VPKYRQWFGGGEQKARTPSREAAKERSPRRKPWVSSTGVASPGGGERNQCQIYRWGARETRSRNHQISVLSYFARRVRILRRRPLRGAMPGKEKSGDVAIGVVTITSRVDKYPRRSTSVFRKMIKPDRSNYTPLDFLEWDETKSLVLTPKFQRRGVWTDAARSFLIDTLLQGMPVPPIYLRVRQSDDKKRIVREVIDGQQRVASVLKFLRNDLKLSKALSGTYAGKKFADLSEKEQDQVRQFAFNCEVFQGIADKEILEIFARLNTYSIPLQGFHSLRTHPRLAPWAAFFRHFAASRILVILVHSPKRTRPKAVTYVTSCGFSRFSPAPNW